MFTRSISRYSLVSIIMCLGTVLASGCGSWRDACCRWDDLDEKIAKLERFHSRFGEISVTKPFLVKDNEFFAMNFEQDAKSLYADIGFQVAARFGTFDAASF